MSEPKNIDTLLKERLQEAEAPVRDGTWEAIQSKMNASTTGSQGVENTSGIAKTSALASSKSIALGLAGAAIIAVGTVALLFNTAPENTSAQQPKPTTESVNNQPIPSEETENLKQKSDDAEPINTDESHGEAALKNTNVLPETADAPTSETRQEAQDEPLVSSRSNGADPKRGESQSSSSQPSEVEEEIAEQSDTDPTEAMNFQVGEQTWENVPQNSITALPMSGAAPLEVALESFVDYARVQWDFGDGSPASNEKNPSHVYEEPGMYTVTLIAQRNDGTVKMEKAMIEVLSPAKNDAPVKGVQAANSSINVPNVFTPNQDGQNDEFRVEAENLQRFNILIFNRAGAVVYESNTLQMRWDGRETDGAECPDGMYFYQITAVGEDGKIYAPKGYIRLIR